MKNSFPPATICPIHKTPLIKMYGCGWDYDRLICGEKTTSLNTCLFEVELQESSYPDEQDKDKE